MLHLLPIRSILIIFALYCGAVTIWAIRNGMLSLSVQDLWFLAKTLIGAPAVLFWVVYLAWRYVNPIQMLIFPKLGGEWAGHISYISGNEIVNKDAKLFVKHDFLGISLVLESEESTSHTLVVYPQKDNTGTQYELYYVFENKRKSEYFVPGRPEIYRGMAIISVDRELGFLSGQYFTEQKSSGNVRFNIIKRSLF